MLSFCRWHIHCNWVESTTDIVGSGWNPNHAITTMEDWWCHQQWIIFRNSTSTSLPQLSCNPTVEAVGAAGWEEEVFNYWFLMRWVWHYCHWQFSVIKPSSHSAAPTSSTEWKGSLPWEPWDRRRKSLIPKNDPGWWHNQPSEHKQNFSYRTAMAISNYQLSHSPWH